MTAPTTAREREIARAAYAKALRKADCLLEPQFWANIEYPDPAPTLREVEWNEDGWSYSVTYDNGVYRLTQNANGMNVKRGDVGSRNLSDIIALTHPSNDTIADLLDLRDNPVEVEVPTKEPEVIGYTCTVAGSACVAWLSACFKHGVALDLAKKYGHPVYTLLRGEVVK